MISLGIAILHLSQQLISTQPTTLALLMRMRPPQPARPQATSSESLPRWVPSIDSRIFRAISNALGLALIAPSQEELVSPLTSFIYFISLLIERLIYLTIFSLLTLVKVPQTSWTRRDRLCCQRSITKRKTDRSNLGRCSVSWKILKKTSQWCPTLRIQPLPSTRQLLRLQTLVQVASSQARIPSKIIDRKTSS